MCVERILTRCVKVIPTLATTLACVEFSMVPYQYRTVLKYGALWVQPLCCLGRILHAQLYCTVGPVGPHTTGSSGGGSAHPGKSLVVRHSVRVDLSDRSLTCS